MPIYITIFKDEFFLDIDLRHLYLNAALQVRGLTSQTAIRLWNLQCCSADSCQCLAQSDQARPEAWISSSPSLGPP